MRARQALLLHVWFVAMIMATQSYAQNFASPVTVTVNVGSRAVASALNMNMSGVGSGVNGPQTSQFGTNMQCTKNNWITTTTGGDTDCMSVNVLQGGLTSSARGVVINEQNTGLGYSNGAEMVTTSIDPSNYSISQYEDVQLGNVFSDGTIDGAIYIAVTGTGAAGISIDTQGAASWTNLLQAAKNNNVYFTITGGGSVLTSGKVNATGLVASGSIQSASLVVTTPPSSGSIARANCGTIMRSVGEAPSTLVVPTGLPTGCRFEVIQASTGVITIRGKGLTVEHYQTDADNDLSTSGVGARVEVLIDSKRTLLLRGAMKPASTGLLAFASSDH